MNKILTIVVPSYNAAQYLPETIPTMLKTAYNEQLEILIVNDGSKDTTQEIAEQFAQENPNVVKVINKANGGHGSTINAGIQQATGKYFKVIDADDWVDTQAFGRLIEHLLKVDVDQVISPYNEVFLDTNVVNKVVYSECLVEREYDYSEFLKIIRKVPQMHSVTIRTSILKERDIFISEKMFYVDTQYTIFPIPYIHRVSYVDLSVYQYRLGTQEQSVNIKNYIKNRNMLKTVLFSIITFVEKHTSEMDAIQQEVIIQNISGIISLLVNSYLAMSDVRKAFREYTAFKRELFQHQFQYWDICDYTKVKWLRLSKDKLFRVLSFYTRKVVYRGEKL